MEAKCAYCGNVFLHKSSQERRCCSRLCHAEIRRTRPKNTPRPCVVCGNIFTPARGRGGAKYCSKRCIWVDTKGPEFNARIGRQYADKQANTQRGSGTKTYVKLRGRHEHRVVAEAMLGRRLKPGEIVHHIDGNKKNNNHGNLKVMTQSEHIREHELWRWRENKIS